MKLLIVFCILFAAVYADWKPLTRDEVYKAREDCFASEKVSEHCQTEIKARQFPDQPGCYFRCFADKLGNWDDKTGMDMERMTEQAVSLGLVVDKNKLTECNSDDRKDDDPCKWAANIYKCLFDGHAVTNKN